MKHKVEFREDHHGVYAECVCGCGANFSPEGISSTLTRILNAASKPRAKYRKVGVVAFHDKDRTVCSLMSVDSRTPLYIRIPAKKATCR